MANYKQLSYGATGEEVKQLQKKLNEIGNYGLDTDGIYGDKTRAAVRDYQQQNSLKVDGIAGDDTWGSLHKTQTGISTPATPSNNVLQAEALLQQQLQKPGAYTSSWQAQLDDILQKIQNREKFSYNMNADALYQQLKDQHVQLGQMASMDAMGQAAALTGGCGSSYGQAVGQQAYQRNLQALMDKAPELYQLALNQHNAEGDELYKQASLAAGMEERDYGRYRDQVSDAQWDKSFQYQQDRDKKADEKWQAEFDEAKRQYDQQYALSMQSRYSGGGPTYEKIDGDTDERILATFAEANSRDGINRAAEYWVKMGYDPELIKAYAQKRAEELDNPQSGSFWRGIADDVAQLLK